MGLHYGYKVPTPGHPTTRETLRIHGIMTEIVTQPHLIDIFPILKRIPPWLSPWHRKAAALFALESSLHERNFTYGLRAPGWNFAKKIRAASSAVGESDFDLAYLVGANTVAGLETSPRALMWILVAALTSKHEAGDSFVTRTQKALDAVVGRERLPTMDDRAALPYLDAVLLELLRWRPVAATGVPHRADSDDVYDGFRIPEGSVVIANIWGIGRDRRVFGENVEEFSPERWLGSTSTSKAAARNWVDVAICRDLPIPFFGYGRRMCTGRHLAEDGLWIVIARMLWAFDIAKTEAGTHLDPMDLRPHGFTITPGPFEVNLIPRGSWVEDVVRREWDAAEKDLNAVLGDMPEKE